MNGTLWLAALGAAVLVAYVIFLKHARATRVKNLPQDVPVRFTKHARERMNQRHITPAQVKAVIANPARHKLDSRQNSVQLEGDYEGRILKVWVVEPWPATTEVVVKTTAWRYYATLTIPRERVGRLIGRNGETIQRLRIETGAHINVKDDGTVHITGGDKATTEDARQRIVATVSPT